MKKIYFYVAVLAAIFAGCDNGEMDNVANDGQVAIEVSAGIEGAKTRMVDTKWETRDKIGIFGKSGKLEYSNRCYNWISGNTFEASSNIIYYGAETGSFTAYYPYAENKGSNIQIKDGKLTRNLLTQVTYDLDKSVDFLYAEATGTKDNPKIDFQFEHKMSKLTLKLVPGEGYKTMSYQPGNFSSHWNFSFSSLHSKVSFEIATGKVEPLEDVGKLDFVYSQNVFNGGSYDKDEKVTYYTFILCPGESVEGGLGVDLTYDNADGYTLHTKLLTGDNVFATEAGKEYMYTVTLNKTKLDVSNTTIKSWDPATLPNDGKAETGL